MNGIIALDLPLAGPRKLQYLNDYDLRNIFFVVFNLLKMKPIIRHILSIILTFFSILIQAQNHDKNYCDGELYIKIKNDKAIPPTSDGKIIISIELPSILSIETKYGIESIRRPFVVSSSPTLQNVYRIKVKKADALNLILEEIKKNEDVEYVEKIPIDRVINHKPNDYSKYSQWHLAKVNAPSAWEISKNSSTVKIAIVDDAIETSHPDLQGNIDFANSRDVAMNDNNPSPDNSSQDHGTHVAGIAGAVTNNNIGVASLAYNAKIIAIKASTSNVTDNISHGYDGITWAANHGAHIINCSWGSTISNQTNQTVINEAISKGCIIVASAGNDNTSTQLYPAAYTGVIAVGATDQNDVKASFSNYGTWVDIWAPGVSIYSTTINGTYGYASGTSMAAPLVASFFALLKGYFPSITNSGLVTRYLQRSQLITDKNTNYPSGTMRRIDAFAALRSEFEYASIYRNNPDYDYIDYVEINNTSFYESEGFEGDKSYFPNPIIDLIKGKNNKLTVLTPYSIKIAAWIDLDNDGAFETSELVYNGSSNIFNTIFTIPCNVSIGTKRLRIRSLSSDAPEIPISGTKYDYGELEEYIVNIIDVPPPIVSTGRTGDFCPGELVTLTSTGCEGGTVTWNPANSTETTIGSSISFVAYSTINYLAKCSYGSCNNSTATTTSIIVSQTPQAPIINVTDCNGLPGKLWDKRFGGSNDESMYGTSLVKTMDGGYIIGGSSSSEISGDKSEISRGSSDYWIVKFDRNGNKQWDKTIGGASLDVLQSIVTASDGGYLLGGYSSSGISGDKASVGKGSADYWVVKINSAGNIIWDRTFGGSGNDRLNAMAALSDGGYLLVGNSDSGISGDKTSVSRGSADYWAVKIDGSGNKIWDKTYGGNSSDVAKKIILTTDGGYLIGGVSYSSNNGEKSEAGYGNEDTWLIKTDVNGNKIWDKTIGSSNIELFEDLITTNDGYLICGTRLTNYTLLDENFWAAKINSDGTEIWQNVYGGNGRDQCKKLLKTLDDNYILAGDSYSGSSNDKTEASQGESDYWLLKINSQGNKLWDKSFGGNAFDLLKAVFLDSDGTILLAGTSNSAISGNKSQGSQGEADLWVLRVSGCNSVSLNNVEPGTLVSLMALAGCAYNESIIWSNGSTSNTIFVTINQTTTFSAKCINPCNAESSPSNVITINVLTPCDPNEPNNTYQEATLIQGNSYESSDLCFKVNTDDDWYKWVFNGKTYFFKVMPYLHEQTGAYRIELQYNEFKNEVVFETLPPHSSERIADTYLYLYDSDGTTLLNSDDDSGEGFLSKLNFRLPLPCISTNITVTGTINQGNHGYYTQQKIQSTQSVTGSSKMIYQSNQSIELTPGFVSTPQVDGIFKAEVGGCND